MLEGLSWAGVGQLSPYGIIVIFFLLMATGRIVSVRTLEREAEAYQKAIELREASNQKLLEQQAKFAELTLAALKTTPTRQGESNASPL